MVALRWKLTALFGAVGLAISLLAPWYSSSDEGHCGYAGISAWDLAWLPNSVTGEGRLPVTFLALSALSALILAVVAQPVRSKVARAASLLPPAMAVASIGIPVAYLTGEAPRDRYGLCPSVEIGVYAGLLASLLMTLGTGVVVLRMRAVGSKTESGPRH